MTLPKGWINRQFARVERDVKNWPDWMRRETELRAQEQKASTGGTKSANDKEANPPAIKKAGA
jgi:hypothetical protein